MAAGDVAITVWHDETSAATAWVVDRCDADGNSSTIRCFRDEAAARAFADDLVKQLN